LKYSVKPYLEVFGDPKRTILAFKAHLKKYSFEFSKISSYFSRHLPLDFEYDPQEKELLNFQETIFDRDISLQ